jgi:fatty acid desaturase
MVITRVRNIAEHAVVGEADDPLRNTRTTLTSWPERAFVAPYFVNYHLEHHLFYYVPCYNLPALHRVLRSGPHGARMEVAPGYVAVLRKATARPDHEDRPGQLVHGLRRQANENTSTSGF